MRILALRRHQFFEPLLPPLAHQFGNVSGRVRRASLTTLANFLFSGVSVVVSLATVSMLIRYLGGTSYGLCITITAMAGWLSVTQAGLGQSFRNETIRMICATVSRDSVTSLFSTTFAFLFFTTLVAGTLLTAISHFIPWSVALNYPGFSRDQRFLYLILASLWMVLLTVPLGVVRAAYSAFQMEFKLAPPLLAGLLISFGLVAIGIHRDWGLVAVVSASLAAAPLGLAFGLASMQGLLATHFSWRAIEWNTLCVLRGPALWFLITEIAALLIFQTDIFLVNLVMGSARATAYALHLQPFLYVQAAAVLFVSPYWSAFGDAWHRGDCKWFRAGVRRLRRGIAILSCCIVAVLLLAGPFLMRTWSHGEVAWNPLLAALMGANVLMQAVTGVSATALGSLGVVREPALLVLFQAVLNVSACFWLIQHFGIVGGACGSLATYAVTSGWYVPWRFRRIARVRLAEI